MNIFRSGKERDHDHVPHWVATLYQVMRAQLKTLEKMMGILEDLQAKADATLASVNAETEIDDAIAQIVNDQRQTIIDLKAQLDAAGQDPAKLAALGETLDAILATNTANAKKVADAVTANTDAG